MTDVHDTKTRSYNMSQIRAKDTKPEMIVRRYLHAKGLRYRLHDKNLPGKPDLVFPKYKVLVQIYGCFWHKHEGCKKFSIPKTRAKQWLNKINETVKRDMKVEKELENLGWRVFVIWECELKKDVRMETLQNLIDKIKNS